MENVFHNMLTNYGKPRKVFPRVFKTFLIDTVAQGKNKSL